MKAIIDRFENDLAICETKRGKFLEIKRKRLPPDAREGDVLIFTKEKIFIDREETAGRRDKIRGLMDDLWK